MNAVRFDGGRLVARSGIVGVAGLVLTAIGAIFDPRRALFAYLTSFVYWLGIVLGALILLMAFHASSAKWPVAVRRILESIPLVLPLFVILFVPIAAGMKTIFPWVDISGATAEATRLWRLRQPYLNVPFFLVRAGFYFLCWIVVGHLLYAWSVRQDDDPGRVDLTLRQRRLGAGGLPLVALAMTFASFDWLMSLEAHLASTIFGVYYFAGSFLGAICVVALAVVGARERGLLGDAVSANHLHSIGKFMLAHVAFWAYIAFSQYMLIWIANLPEEVPWYLFRNRGGWAPVGIFLVAAHFVIPFFALLSRDLKRSPRGLTVIAVWLLVVHYVDMYWVVMPRLHPEAPHPSWMDVTALVGVGGVALAFGLWRMRGRATVPVGDPYLEASVGYEPAL